MKTCIFMAFVCSLVNSALAGTVKKMFLLCAVLICYINGALSGINTTPGMQRRYIGETAAFQWSVTETLSDYSVYNSQSGILRGNASYALDSYNGLVTLTIMYIQLSDAGNYTLSVTIGTTTQTNNGALLFVYGPPTIFVNQTSDGSRQLQSTEGDTVELTCTAISTSLPEAYRPTMYYQWYLSWIGTLQNISGPAKLVNYDNSIPGYSIKDDVRTIVIEMVQYRDIQSIYCYGQEQWSRNRYSAYFYLQLKYRPYVYSRTPASKIVNAILGDSVSLRFYYQAVPALISATNWSFINTAGHEQNLPANVTSSSLNPFTFTFTLTSEAYYGNYSITLNNTIGSTTEIFQIRPPGPPDAPSSVKALFLSNYLIVIAFNCMSSNGRQQTTFLQLKTPYNNSVIDSSNTSLYLGCYNSTYTTQFRNLIQPETEYDILVSSVNVLGSSDVIKLKVKTKTIKFLVSPKTISLNGNQAIVNFTTNVEKIARLDVTCCLESTGACFTTYHFNTNSKTNQVTYDNLPSGDVYIFDFTVNGGDPNIGVYYWTILKGVRVSRNEDAGDDPITEPGGAQTNNLLNAVIVLGVLLGVAVLALIVCLIAYLVFKRRQGTQPSNSHQAQPKPLPVTRTPQPTIQRDNNAYEDDDAYEAVDVDPSKDYTHYTALEGQR